VIRSVLRSEEGRDWPVLVWAPGPGWRMISTGVAGGGLGERAWWLNAQVPRDYARTDPEVHVRQMADALGLAGCGVGFLTALDVRHVTQAEEHGLLAVTTVGLGLPVAAAAPADDVVPDGRPGTINILVVVPAPMSDAALVNLVATATEAKVQALQEAGVPGTGTSSDAVCIACPTGGDPREPFGGPRSTWGARTARTVHLAVAEGTAGWCARNPDGAGRPPW
jgi:adenosylcobinamide hydrolase